MPIGEPWLYNSNVVIHSPQYGGFMGLGAFVPGWNWWDVCQTIDGYRQPIQARTYPGQQVTPEVRNGTFFLLHMMNPQNGDLGFIRPHQVPNDPMGNSGMETGPAIALNLIKGSLGDPFMIEKENPADPIVHKGDKFFLRGFWTIDPELWLAVGEKNGYATVGVTLKANRQLFMARDF